MFQRLGFDMGLMNPAMGTRNFVKKYRVFPVSFMTDKDRTAEENGGKIIMPPSALEQLARLNIQYPMLFKLRNDECQKSMHCGVLEFVADEGKIYIPYWMMKNLLFEEGKVISVENISLPTATYAKFQPQNVDFLDISNPKAVLERALRNFACLTMGDTIAIVYNKKQYEFEVLETKPGSAVSIIECDMNVEFAAPVGYKEPSRPDEHRDLDPAESAYIEREVITDSFKAFKCEGNRLDGKAKKGDQLKATDEEEAKPRGIPNYNYKRNIIHFIRSAQPKSNDETQEPEKFNPFPGSGRDLKPLPLTKPAK